MCVKNWKKKLTKHPEGKSRTRRNDSQRKENERNKQNNNTFTLYQQATLDKTHPEP